MSVEGVSPDSHMAICVQRYKNSWVSPTFQVLFDVRHYLFFVGRVVHCWRNRPNIWYFLWLFVLNSEVKLMIFEYRFHNIITDKFGQQMFGGPAGKSRSAAVAVE